MKRILIIASCALLLGAGCGRTSAPTPLPSLPQISEAPHGFLKFNGDRYSLHYPETWTKDESKRVSGAQVLFFAPFDTSNISHANISVMALPYTSKLGSLNELQQQSTRELEAAGAHSVVATIVPFARETALKVTYILKQFEVEYTGVQYVVIHEEKTFLVLNFTADREGNDYLKEFENLVNTVSLD